MINFIALESRQCFRRLLIELDEFDQRKDLIIRFQSQSCDSFEAAVTVKSIRKQQSKNQVLQWLICDTRDRKEVKLQMLSSDDLSKNRPIYKHSQGEIINLYPQSIWYVDSGLVKLSTLCKNGAEVIVGLAKKGMVFGSSMTSQQIYQAVALSDISLVSISLQEILDSPILSQILLPKLNQRLCQTESLLVISGTQKVEDRLIHLLQFLKEEVGEKLAQGTRLSIRLTHEEIAIACNTTRVTITRLLGKLKKQRKISFDLKRHMIIHDVL